MLRNSYLIVNCGYTSGLLDEPLSQKQLTQGFSNVLSQDKLIFLEDPNYGVQIHNKDLCITPSDFNELRNYNFNGGQGHCRGSFCIYTNERKIAMLSKQLDKLNYCTSVDDIEDIQEFKLASGNSVTYIEISSSS